MLKLDLGVRILKLNKALVKTKYVVCSVFIYFSYSLGSQRQVTHLSLVYPKQKHFGFLKYFGEYDFQFFC